MDNTFIYSCSFCKYSSKRKYNLERHEINKHSKEILTKIKTQENVKNKQNVPPIDQNVTPIDQNVTPNDQNVTPIDQNVTPNDQNVTSNKLICKKCNKIYLKKSNLIKHEEKCNRIDNLTCPKCMISFTCRQHKNRHIKKNNCKARSIIHARTPNIQNINNNINNYTINNITNNSNCNNNYTININNYGNERIDYLTHDDIKKILLSGHNTIPLYIENKHFNKEFPENNNIKYTNECKCLLKENDKWKEKDLTCLSNRLIKDNSKILLLYCKDNEIQIDNEINNEEIFNNMKDKLFIIYNKTDNEKYNDVLKKIKELIKTNSK